MDKEWDEFQKAMRQVSTVSGPSLAGKLLRAELELGRGAAMAGCWPPLRGFTKGILTLCCPRIACLSLFIVRIEHVSVKGCILLNPVSWAVGKRKKNGEDLCGLFSYIDSWTLYKGETQNSTEVA